MRLGSLTACCLDVVAISQASSCQLDPTLFHLSALDQAMMVAMCQASDEEGGEASTHSHSHHRSRNGWETQEHHSSRLGRPRASPPPERLPETPEMSPTPQERPASPDPDQQRPEAPHAEQEPQHEGERASLHCNQLL